MQQKDQLSASLKEADDARKLELEALQRDLQQLVDERRRQEGIVEAIIRQVCEGSLCPKSNSAICSARFMPNCARRTVLMSKPRRRS